MKLSLIKENDLVSKYIFSLHIKFTLEIWILNLNDYYLYKLGKKVKAKNKS